MGMGERGRERKFSLLVGMEHMSIFTIEVFSN